MQKHLPIIFLYLCLYLPLPSLANDQKIRANTSNDALRHVQYAISPLTRNLSLAQFSLQIKEKYPTTYRFLNKLSAQQQKTVYRFYHTENHFEPIRHKIFTLFFAIPETEQS